MKTLLPFQNLSRAAELLDDFARRHGLADGFDAQYFLALAVRDILLPYVVLPSQFHYDRIQRSLRIPLKHPEYVTPFPDGKGTFPRDAAFFYIDRLTAHNLIVQAGKPVELRSLCNLRADGRTEKFSAVEPFVQITVDDLRVTDEQLRCYAQRLLSEHQKSSQEAADTQRIALDDAAAFGKTSKPSVTAEPDESRASAMAAAGTREALADETACGEADTPSDATVPPAAERREDKYPYPDDVVLTKTERKIRRIEWLARKLGYSPTSIQYGGKARLSEECRKRWPELFGSGKDPFIEAWKHAGDRLRTENHDRYTSK